MKLTATKRGDQMKGVKLKRVKTDRGKRTRKNLHHGIFKFYERNSDGGNYGTNDFNDSMIMSRCKSLSGIET